MKDGTVERGQTGDLPKIVDGVQTAPATLPALPNGTNIIVGPLGQVNADEVIAKPDGTLIIPNRPVGVVVYYVGGVVPAFQLTTKAVERIIK